MLNLGQTIDTLARYRRQWDALLSGPEAEGAPTGLREVTGFGDNPGNLRMFAHVPARLQRRAPLVVLLHGCKQNAAGIDRGTGWSTLADRFGFALLVPEQRRRNNPNMCFDWFLPEDTARGSGEAESIRQMIGRMVADHGIDAGRIHVTGLSAGGAMTAVMLATYPELFAGGAVVAGLPYGAARSVPEALEAMFHPKSRPAQAWGDLVRAASPHTGPWPKLSVWHGDADATVLPLNAGEAVKQWLDVHGLGPDPAEESVDGPHTRRVWRNAAGEPVVEQHSLAGMAHGVAIHPGEGGERCGVAGPFILDVGVSSTWRIAASWGLTDGVPEVETARPAAAPTLGGKLRRLLGRVLKALKPKG